jgi:ubiquinone/menaquinone biosynthesis C-methylase UbiE
MERVPEAELMLGDEQARAYARADFEEPHSRFVELLQGCFPDLPRKGTALDLGCGPADVTIRFARALPLWSVDGVDGSPAMLHYGKEAVENAGLQDRISLTLAHLPGGNLPRSRYDHVFSNSLLHHLADPEVLWNSVGRWAATGTPVFVMDLMRPESRDRARVLVEQYAAGEPEILRHDFFHSLLAAYEVGEVEAQLRAAGLPHLRVRACSDRHLIAWGRR